jgi:DnaJ-class molecular chaperone
MKFHPDLNPLAGAEQVFARAYQAYRCLSDPDARIAYDAHLVAAERGELEQPAPPEQPRRKPRRGADRNVVLRVPRRIRAQRVVLEFDRWDACDQCRATGETDGRPCPTCLGIGQVLAKQQVALRIKPRRMIGGSMVLPEEGDVGLFGGPRGDAVVSVLTPENTVVGSIWPAIVAALVFYALIGMMVLGWLLSS